MKNKPHRKGSAHEEYIPASLQAILDSFASCFTKPSFDNFLALVSGWILCQGQHRISRVIQFAGGSARSKHASALYRFLSRARWSSDDCGRILFGLLLRWLPRDVEASVDDTLCHRSGPHVFGGGMHHDGVRSTYGRGTTAGRFAAFAFGLNWVVLAVRLPLPWDARRGVAVPILFRLYRSKRTCPESKYRKRTELALDLLRILESWAPTDSRLFLAGDAEYACQVVVQGKAASTIFIGPMAMGAALYEPAGAYSGSGRPRKKGKRIDTPKDFAADRSVKWRTVVIQAYGRKVKVKIKERCCLWYTVNGSKLVKMVVTRDPKGRIADRAYFSTDSGMSAEELLERFSRRWMIEVCFRDAKQLMGIEDPQNGWGRRRQGARRRRKRPGPQARGRKGETAVLHTLPLAFTAYGVVLVWYLRHGDSDREVVRALKRAPWNRRKTAPCFLDMLVALRREFWAGRLSRDPTDHRSRRKVRNLIPDALLAA